MTQYTSPRMGTSVIRKYLVGGAVRDRMLGLKYNDLDYAVTAPSFAAMKFWLEGLKAHIYQERPEYGTIRANLGGENADFVLCRKDGFYTDGRHPDTVTTGTLEDDLGRRDFTINAMAEDEEGNVIDLFGGVRDLEARILRAVGPAAERIREDPLRGFRALRLCVTKNMQIDAELKAAMLSGDTLGRMGSVSTDRIRDELVKAFEYDSFKTMYLLINPYSMYGGLIKDRGIWFKPTTKDMVK